MRKRKTEKGIKWENQESLEATGGTNLICLNKKGLFVCLFIVNTECPLQIEKALFPCYLYAGTEPALLGKEIR